MDALSPHERYANFYTDFAFKKLFGTETNKECLIGFLNSLFDGEEVITDVTYPNTEHIGHLAIERKAVFKRFFEAAEIANFTRNEIRDYRESQKEMWDMYAITTTAEAKGIAKGIEQGLAEGEYRKAVSIAQQMKKDGFAAEIIAKYSGLTVEQINEI